jgi:dTDP-4-amino-4,6-dideoxygalactose transaminase
VNWGTLLARYLVTGARRLTGEGDSQENGMMQKSSIGEDVEPAAVSEIPMPAPSASEVWPFFDEDEIAAVAGVLRSGRVNQWTGGKAGYVRGFEHALAGHCGVKHAIALANGSLALELALLAFGIGPGDEVIVTSRSFIASASCVDLVGATPVFADVDARSQNMTPATIAPLVTARTRAIIPVHLAGWPCDMAGIMALARQHKLVVIEDCAQAIGASIGGRKVGGFGDAAVYSFCQDKIITTGGEGGALLLDDDKLWRFAWSFKDHGKDFAKAEAPAGSATYRWLHDSVGTNWRMTEMQAAIGIVQMGKLDAWLGLRQRNAKAWIDGLSPLDCIEVHLPPATVEHAWYKLGAFVKPERLKAGIDRDVLLAALTRNGVRAFYGSCPEIYRDGAYEHRQIERRPVARQLGETSLMFEVHPTLREETIRAMARKVVELVKPMQVV